MDWQMIMRRLGYTESWLRAGVVTHEYLVAQYQEFVASEDQNQEHYRCGAYVDYLTAHPVLSDEQITAVLDLTDDGPDRCDLRSDRIIRLIASGALSDAQLFALGTQCDVERPPVGRRYYRECILRRVRRDGLTEEVFRLITESEDTHLHEHCLAHPDLGVKHVSWLANRGGNKAVRNRARELLRSARFRHQRG